MGTRKGRPRTAARIRTIIRLHRTRLSTCTSCRWTALRCAVCRVPGSTISRSLQHAGKGKPESPKSRRHLSRPGTYVHRTSGTSFHRILPILSHWRRRCSSFFGRSVERKSTRRRSCVIVRRARREDSDSLRSRVKPPRITLSKHSESRFPSAVVLPDLF